MFMMGLSEDGGGREREGAKGRRTREEEERPFWASFGG